MKPLHTIITGIILLTATMFLSSCHDIPASYYQKALIALLESGKVDDTVAVEDEDIYAGRERIAITGYVLYSSAASGVLIIADDGTKYNASFPDGSGLGLPYLDSRVVVEAVVDGEAAGAVQAVPVIITGICLDSAEDDVVIRGRVGAATGTSAEIIGNDGTTYLFNGPKEYIDLLRQTAFWGLYVRARLIDRYGDACGDYQAITVLYCKLDSEAVVSKTGTVRYNNLEGGFWCIIDDDGRGYDMNNLPEEFFVEGLRVKFTAKMSNKCAAYHMWGFCVELVDILPM